MPVTVTKKVNIKKRLAKIKSAFNAEVVGSIKDVVKDEIRAGKSPVQGMPKFEKYTKEYATRKGVSQNQVDMTMSGKMLRSLKVRVVGGLLRTSSVRLWFSSGIAKYHNTPGLARVLRRLLPSLPGETFKPKITKVIMNALRKAVRQNTKR